MSGPDFEVAFMDSMIRHHRKAVREGEMCLRRAYHDELIDLCQNIITTQTAEMGQVNAWLCEWYHRCTGRPEAA